MTIAAHMPSAEAVLQSVVKHRRSAFSVGVTGALAEFHWLLPDDAVLERCSEALTRVTARGAFDFTVPEDVRPVAVCRPSSRSERCFREVLFCLPTRSAGMAGHRVLRDLGLDEGAIQPGQRGHRLFDLGLGIAHVDVCVRTDDLTLIDVLQDHCGRGLLAEAPDAVAVLKRRSPHRVFLSRLGRIEVYQEIGSSAHGASTPLGPHTHLLPHLLGRGGQPSGVPARHVCALTLHWSERREDEAQFAALLDAWGDPT